MTSVRTLRLGTRGSLLARMQSGWVARELQRLHPSLSVETTIIKTTGDKIIDRPLHKAGGKGLFVKEIEQALLAGTIDFAVHSFKDVPVTMPLVDPAGLMIAAVPKREDARDALISMSANNIRALPEGAIVGTGSFRRKCQLQSLRPDLRIQPIRGNIDTRLHKLRDGDFDAIILAQAGLVRAGLFDPMLMYGIPVEELLPAAGQGALALQCRAGDKNATDLLSVMNDTNTALCVAAEREMVKKLEGDCTSPIAVFAEIHGEKLHYRAAVGAAGGHLPVISAGGDAPVSNWMNLVEQTYQMLLVKGIQEILHPRR